MKTDNSKAHEEQLEEITKRRKNVPGLDKLRQARIEARNEEKYYDAMYERLVDDGECIDYSQIVRIRRDEFLKLSRKYPRAAAYLRAMEYYNSSVHRESCVGFAALQMIVSGGSLLTAKRILNNRLTENGGEPPKTNPT